MRPSTVSAGASTEITAAFTNPTTARQQLGSVNLEPPARITVTSVTTNRGTAAVRNGVVELRNLSLAPGGSMAATITVQAPCAAQASADWPVTLKQANDFKGVGNDITLTATSTRSTSVSGSCRLAFTTQPTSTGVDQVIKGGDGTPVGVAFVDGAGDPVPSGTESVTLSVAEPVGAPDPINNTAPFNSSTGIASFGAMSIGTPGTYRLLATVTSGNAKGTTSDPSSVFRIDTISKVCEAGRLCTGTVVSNETSFTLDALASRQTPRLTLSLGAGIDVDEALCGARPGSFYMSDTALFNVTESDRQKRMSLTVPRDDIQFEPDNGAPRIEMCFASPEAFYPKGSATKTLPSRVTFDWNADGFDEQVFVGLLPNCPAPEANQPCVTQRKKISGGRGYIEATLPSTYGDPAMRG
jgi:hypothetical protein